jgi:hypothetical protein
VQHPAQKQTRRRFRGEKGIEDARHLNRVLSEWWSGGVVEWWSGGVLEYWSGGVLEWWSTGVVEYWSIGVLSAWMLEFIRPFRRFFHLLSLEAV